MRKPLWAAFQAYGYGIEPNSDSWVCEKCGGAFPSNPACPFCGHLGRPTTIMVARIQEEFELAVKLTKEGKPFCIESAMMNLHPILARIEQLEAEIERLKTATLDTETFNQLVHEGQEMKAAFKKATKGSNERK